MQPNPPDNLVHAEIGMGDLFHGGVEVVAHLDHALGGQRWVWTFTWGATLAPGHLADAEN